LTTDQPPITNSFAAPEVLKGDPHGGKEIDIWALGVILFVLITGECPFWNPEEAAKGIGEGSRARTKLEDHIKKRREARTSAEPEESQSGQDNNDDDESESMLDLLKHCLNLEAHMRPSIEHICWHKFFLPSGGWSGPSIPAIAEPAHLPVAPVV
jgi:serine/threonine protein kinase